MTQLFSCIAFLICNSTFDWKQEKLTALLYFYIGAILAYPGITLVAIDPNLLIFYLFIIGIFLYSFSFMSTTYISIASVCMVFAVRQIELTIIPGNIHEAFNLWMAININFSILFLLSYMLPEDRYKIIYQSINHSILYLKALYKNNDNEKHINLIDDLSIQIHKLATIQKVVNDPKLEMIIQDIRTASININLQKTIIEKGNEELLTKSKRVLRETWKRLYPFQFNDPNIWKRVS